MFNNLDPNTDDEKHANQDPQHKILSENEGRGWSHLIGLLDVAHLEVEAAVGGHQGGPPLPHPSTASSNRR